MLDIREVAAWAGAIMTIVTLVAYFIRPIMGNFTKITKKKKKMSHSLDLLNRDLEASKTDRQLLHKKLEKHEERMDDHRDKLTSHDEQLKTLFRERG